MLACPPFSRGPRTSVVDRAVENDSCSYARIENVTVALAGPPETFRQSGCVRIVVDFDGKRITFGHSGREREIAPAWEVWGIHNNPGLRIKWSWRANSN